MYPPHYEGGKPNFKCNSCGDHWQYGIDGGKYAELAGKRGVLKDLFRGKQGEQTYERD